MPAGGGAARNAAVKKKKEEEAKAKQAKEAGASSQPVSRPAGQVAIPVKPVKNEGEEDVEPELNINMDNLLRRLQLERSMSSMIVKMPTFCISLLCFMVAISILVPSEKISTVHRRLYQHFGIDAEGLSAITDFDSMYGFIDAFEVANEEVSATSAKYWCESRYFQLQWDDSLMVPTRSCPSPRLYALGQHMEQPTTWLEWQQDYNTSSPLYGTEDNDTDSSSSSSASSAHRRLGGGSSSGSAAAGSSSAEPAACVDDDAELQREEGRTDITCASDKAHICATDLGVVLCPVSCGFCPDFTYQHTRYYDKPMTAMLPVMVHQTRFQTAACHDFASVYENQPHNYDLATMPALDGPHHGRTLTCIDRTKRFEGDYAHELECPTDGPADLCPGGKRKMTKVHTYHGDPVYAMFLTEPEKNMAMMRSMQWLDLQTEQVVVSTLVYTEDVESYTSVSVIFDIDEAGSVSGQARLISYTDLVANRKLFFEVLLIVANLSAFAGVLASLHKLYKDPHCDWSVGCFELLSRTLMCVYCLVLQLTQLQQIPMAEEYDHLLHTILDFHGHSAAEWEDAVQKYFDTKTHIYYETQWLLSHRIASYLLLYVQFLQLVIYFHGHPRMAVLTSTVMKSLDMMFHFMVLFSVLFCMLAFTASWMLGGEVPAFRSYGESIASQGKMLFGEWIYADNADELFGSMVVMYWIFAITFMLVLFFSLLNFFLAIVLDAFVSVQEEMQENPTEQNFIMDLWDALTSPQICRRAKWPCTRAMLRVLEDSQRFGERGSYDRIWTVKALVSIFPQEDPAFKQFCVPDSQALKMYLAFYSKKCSEIMSEEHPNHRPPHIPQPDGGAPVKREETGEVLQLALRSAAERIVPELEQVWGPTGEKKVTVETHGIDGGSEIVRVTLSLIQADEQWVGESYAADYYGEAQQYQEEQFGATMSQVGATPSMKSMRSCPTVPTEQISVEVNGLVPVNCWEGGRCY